MGGERRGVQTVPSLELYSKKTASMREETKWAFLLLMGALIPIALLESNSFFSQQKYIEGL